MNNDIKNNNPFYTGNEIDFLIAAIGSLDWICNKLGYYSRHYQADYNVLFNRVFPACSYWNMADPVPVEICFS